MLRYRLKADNETEYAQIKYRNLHVSPDLMYISGETDSSSDVIDKDRLYLTNSLNGASEIVVAHTETVHRVGIIPYTLTLPIERREFSYYPTDELAESSTTTSYVEHNGDISFIKDGKVVIDDSLYAVSGDSDTLEINCFAYIDDGVASIDGTDIKVDVFDGTMYMGRLMDIISSESAYTSNNGHQFIITKNPIISKDYDSMVTKFYIERGKDNTIPYDDVQFGGYRHYVTYNGENIYGKQTSSYTFNIDGNEISAVSNYSDSSEYSDVPFEGSAIEISSGVYLDIHDELMVTNTGGSFVVFAMPDHQFNVNIGSVIEVTSDKPFIADLTVYSGDNDSKYVVFCGRRYDIDDKAASYAEHEAYSGVSYPISDIAEDESGNTKGTIRILDSTVELMIDFESSGATQTNKIFYSQGKDIYYGINSSNTYTVKEVSGITVNDEVFSGSTVEYATGTNTSGLTNADAMVLSHVRVSAYMPMKFIVGQIVGTSMYLCYPMMDADYINPLEIEHISREMCGMIIQNKDSLTLKLKNALLGEDEVSVYSFLPKALGYWMPLEASKYNMLERYIHIYRMSNYRKISFPLTYSPQNNLTREDTLFNKYIDSIKKNTVNSIVDMEKDVYYPVKKTGNDYIFDDIHTIRFNMHFRTRNLDNWKVINDDRESSASTSSATLNYCNWFITDYKFYNGSENNEDNNYVDNNFLNRLQRSSDLLGFLGFTDSEVRNQASKIGKSFLRLSFYSTKDPQTQVLLSTSTVFLNEQYALKKYMTYRNQANLNFVDTYLYEEGTNSMKDGVNCFSELVVDVPTDDSTDENTNIVEPIEYPGADAFTRAYNRNDRRGNRGSERYDYSDNEGTPDEDAEQPSTNTLFAPALIDGCRMSSRIEVDCKHLASESAEGYYLYMFKDYARRKMDTTIYLRVDFNHAGVGQSIPMIIPTGGEDEHVLTLSDDEDMKALKRGYGLREMYNHLYIPVHIRYDEARNRYVYWLDEKYNILNTDEPSVMEFNLFEVKYKNEVFG